MDANSESGSEDMREEQRPNVRRFLPYDSALTPLAREQRKAMTAEERRLWWFLRSLPMRVHRKKPIGRFIVDFYVASRKTVIEIEGSRLPGTPGKKRGPERDRFYAELGIMEILIPVRFIRQQFDRVCKRLKERLEIDEYLLRHPRTYERRGT